MKAVNVTPGIPQELEDGLKSGALERIGGVIMDRCADEALAFLREGCEVLGEEFVRELTGGAAAVSMPSAAAFNLAVSTMGFAVVMKHLNTIEDKLRRAQELLSIINYKIDLSFYSNFRAAVDLAGNSFSMSNPEMRKASALQAINRLLEAEHHYLHLADVEIANGSQVADDFLATVSLAWIAEVRCYLELEELPTARQRLQDGLVALHPRYARHIRTLLTSNPAAYLHPKLQNDISLARLTRVFRWFDPELDEKALFESQRRNLFDFSSNVKAWQESLPYAVYIPKPGLLDKANLGEITKQLRGIMSGEDLKARALALSGWLGRDRKIDNAAAAPRDALSAVLARLPDCLDLIETMIENIQRFEMYRLELDTIRDLGVSFQEWKRLRPDEPEAQTARIFCITRSKERAHAA